MISRISPWRRQDRKVWTKIGQDTTSNLYMGLPTPIWKDNQDCAYLRDENDVVDTFCYGYDLLEQLAKELSHKYVSANGAQRSEAILAVLSLGLLREERSQ